MMHDMAITEDFAILLDVPLVFRPEVMVTKNRLPLVYDKSRPARFGIIPKRPKSGKEVRWFSLDPGEPYAVILCVVPEETSLRFLHEPWCQRHAWNASRSSSGINIKPPGATEKCAALRSNNSPSELHPSGQQHPSESLPWLARVRPLLCSCCCCSCQQ